MKVLYGRPECAQSMLVLLLSLAFLSGCGGSSQEPEGDDKSIYSSFAKGEARACRGDDPCAAGSYCLDGRCVFDCSANSDCFDGEVCSPSVSERIPRFLLSWTFAARTTTKLPQILSH